MTYQLKNHPVLTLLIVGIIFYILFILITPTVWPVSPDAILYARMADGEDVEKPFKNRILIPIIVGMFPRNFHAIIFLSITFLSLLGTYIIIFYYLINLGLIKKASFIGSVLWLFSYISTFHLYNFGLIDPSLLLIQVTFFYILNSQKKYLLFPLLWIGVLIKEAIILLIPFVLIDIYFEKRITNRLILVLAIIPPVVFYITNLTLSFQSLGFDVKYLQSNHVPVNFGVVVMIISFVCVNFAWYFYIYGPLGILAIFHIIHGTVKYRVFLIIAVLEVIILNLTVYDWYRMIFYLYPLIIPVEATCFNTMKKKTLSSSDPVSVSLLCLIIFCILGPFSWWYFIRFGTSVRLMTSIIFIFLGCLTAAAYWKRKTIYSIQLFRHDYKQPHR